MRLGRKSCGRGADYQSLRQVRHPAQGARRRIGGVGKKLTVDSPALPAIHITVLSMATTTAWPAGALSCQPVDRVSLASGAPNSEGRRPVSRTAAPSQRSRLIMLARRRLIRMGHKDPERFAVATRQITEEPHGHHHSN